jgi:hypothetical protein
VEGGSALRALHLSKTQLTDKGLEHIRNFASLNVLELSQTRISDDGLVHLAALANLMRLSLCGTRITANGLMHLQALPSLKILELDWADIDDRALATFERMSALRNLHLKGTRTTYSAIEAFSKRRLDVTVSWAPTLRLIGYWSDDKHAEKLSHARAFRKPIETTTEAITGEGTDADSAFIHPRSLVDPTWARQNRGRVVKYLAGARTVAHAAGHSYCRFGCGLTGCAELSDGVWLWPEGLAHYVKLHDVRLPDEFLEHIRNRGYSPSPAKGVPLDFGCQSSEFWRAWCAAQKLICRKQA